MTEFQINIIGAGNVASHLCKALHDAGMHQLYVHSRKKESSEKTAKQCHAEFGTKTDKLPAADLWIFALADDALRDIVKNQTLKQKINNALCAHTAGSVSKNILLPLSENTGVFYPLQTFNKDIPLNFREVPIFIEANTEPNRKLLQNVAERISRHVNYLSESQRMLLHPAAVFACNFVNHHLDLARQITDHHNIDFKLLHPLITETIRKALEHGPQNSQTGPAVRNDRKTLENHRKLLKDLPDIQKIYTFVSDSIQAQNKPKNMDNFKERLKDIKGFVFDVDGVFSDLMILHTNGDLMRHMNVKDGFAVKTAVDTGYQIGIITGGDSESVRSRFERLGVKHIYLESPDKNKDFDDFLRKTDLQENQILYMGDDLPDFAVMKRCALATCPADAVEEIQNISHYISDKPGGRGCVRDVIEQVMRAQEKWQQLNGSHKQQAKS